MNASQRLAHAIGEALSEAPNEAREKVLRALRDWGRVRAKRRNAMVVRQKIYESWGL